MKHLSLQLRCSLCILLTAFFATTVKAADRNGRMDWGNINKPGFFPILPWDPQHGWNETIVSRGGNGLESIAACNFNMGGFVTGKDLPDCWKFGLGAIVTYTEAGDGRGAFHGWKELSDEQIEARIKRMIKATGSSPAIQGYFIVDEPGVSEFAALGKAVAAVKKHAPGKMAYINLFPDYATIGAPDKSQLGTSNYTEYLERFVTEVKPQFLSYDNYMVQMSMDLKNPAKFASYYQNLLEVRRVALKHNLPYLQIVSANQIRPFTTVPSPANLSFQAYTTLAAGCRGVTWYTYYGGGYQYAPVDAAGKKTLTWAYLREVNRQVATLAPVMSRLTSTGVFFSSPAPVSTLPLLPGDLVETATCDRPLMIGEFKHADGQRYLMVVNLSLESSAKFNLQIKGAKALHIISAVDSNLSSFDQKNGLWVAAGQGVLLKVE
jgi:hypothetical protein